MYLKRSLLKVIPIIVLLSIFGCKEKGGKTAGPDGGKKVKIGVIHFLANHPDHILLRESFLDGLKAKGYDVEVENIFDTNSPKYPDTYQKRPPVEAKRMVKAGVDLIYNTATGHLVVSEKLGVPVIDSVFMAPKLLGYAEEKNGKFYCKTNATGILFGYSFKDIVNLAKDLKPKNKKLAYIYNPKSPISRPVEEIRSAANPAGLTIVEYPFTNKNEAIKAVEKASKSTGVGFATNDIAVVGAEKLAINKANSLKYPLICSVVPLVDAGAPVAIQYDWSRAGKMCADKADKIFQGTPGSSIPLEYADSIEIGVNLKTIRALGLKTPHAWVEAAVKVVE